MVRDALSYQGTVQPASIPTSLVATHDVGVREQAKALPRPRDLLLYPGDISSWDSPFARRLGHTDGEAQLPCVLPQFKRQIQRGLGERILLDAGRYGGCQCLTPS